MLFALQVMIFCLHSKICEKYKTEMYLLPKMYPVICI